MPLPPTDTATHIHHHPEPILGYNQGVKMRTITLTQEQVETLVDQLVEDRDSLNDYLLDGTFDDDQDQKEQAINDVKNIDEILKQL